MPTTPSVVRPLLRSSSAMFTFSDTAAAASYTTDLQSI